VHPLLLYSLTRCPHHTGLLPVRMCTCTKPIDRHTHLSSSLRPCPCCSSLPCCGSVLQRAGAPCLHPAQRGTHLCGSGKGKQDEVHVRGQGGALRSHWVLPTWHPRAYAVCMPGWCGWKQNQREMREAKASALPSAAQPCARATSRGEVRPACKRQKDLYCRQAERPTHALGSPPHHPAGPF